jgi:uncharacterized protein YeaO (DUF488 family)
MPGWDDWWKDCAPTPELREWYRHDPDNWPEFCTLYNKELEEKADRLHQVLQKIQGEPIVLLYGAKEREYNNATALRELLENRPQPERC